MPLHDWTDRPGWEGMRHLWITELLRWVKRRLPSGYRVSSVRRRSWRSEHRWAVRTSESMTGQTSRAVENVPHREASSSTEDLVRTGHRAGRIATLDPVHRAVGEKQGRLIAAIELISPRNKDRPRLSRNLPGPLSRIPSRVRASPAGGRTSPADRILRSRTDRAGIVDRSRLRFRPRWP